MPMGRQRYLYLPDGSRKVVRYEDSSSIGIWKYPLTASRLAKTFASDGMDCKMSFVLGKGWVGLSMYLLRGEKSVTSLTSPFALGTKKAWLHQSVGSDTFVITRLLIRWETCLSALF